MRVHHRVDVGTGAIHLGVDVIFERLTRGPFDEIPLEIHRDDVVHRQRASHRRTRVDVEGCRIAPGAAVAVVIDVAGALEHPDRIDELLLHDMTRLFQSSHDRPTVARLMASAFRPSSRSSAAIGPPSLSASAAPRAALLMTMSVVPNLARMSKTGTPQARNAAL